MNFTLFEFVLLCFVYSIIEYTIKILYKKIKTDHFIKKNGAYIECDGKIFKSFDELEQYLKEKNKC